MTNLKALNWRQIASLTNDQLDAILETEGDDVYDDVTIDLALKEYDNREEAESMASESQAAYDDFWRS